MRRSTKSTRHTLPTRQLALIITGLVLLGLAGEGATQNVTFERLVRADREPANWMTYYGAYNGWRYSALNQINTQNAGKLAVKWTLTVGKYQGLQVTPIVVDGIMYITSADSDAHAFNAATGERCGAMRRPQRKGKMRNRGLPWLVTRCSWAPGMPTSWLWTPRPENACGEPGPVIMTPDTGSPRRR